MGERQGFDGINELRFHAGIDAHRNENQPLGAEPMEYEMAA
jgi:hypothetical protein